MNLELENHVAVVTGGASGIGLATAKLFAAEGCRVAIWDVAPQVADVAKQLTNETGQTAIGCVVDVARQETIARAREATRQQLGEIDHVVHAAAIGSGQFGFPFTEVDPEAWRRVVEINILGTTFLAHEIAPQLIARRTGTLIFVASVAGQIGSQTDPPYSASKAANINFAQCLAKDLAPHGVRVNTVCPGMVQTPLNKSVWQAWHDRQPADQQLSYEDWAAQKIRQVVPLGRWQTPDDVANLIVFLSSPRAGEITGQTINVDGGFVMHW